MTFPESVSDAFAKFGTAQGRSSRSAYWWFALFSFLVIVVGAIIDAVAGTAPIFYAIAALAILVPSITVGIRRLHDTGRSGWWLLIGIFPLLGGLVLLYFNVQPSGPPNEYGAGPDGHEADTPAAA